MTTSSRIASPDLAPPYAGEDNGYAEILYGLADALRSSEEHTRYPLFTTEATGLFDAFLRALPFERRGHYECRSCRHFVTTFGGLVTIDKTGETSSLWSTFAWPSFFTLGLEEMDRVARRAKVNGVFLRSDAGWGLRSNESPKAPGGRWYHMHLNPTAEHLYRSSRISASQAMAEKREDHGTLCRGLAEIPLPVVRQAHTLLTTGSLARSEKHIGVAKWLLELEEKLAGEKNDRRRHNLTWLAAATAPPGYCHIRSTMIGTLLQGIADGLSFGDLKRSFDAKMDPLQYMRPQAAPTDGQLHAAESLVQKLGVERALARRYARLEEVLPHAIWTPRRATPDLPADASVFGHLKKRPAPVHVEQPPVILTWEKFTRTVLPTAERIEYLVTFGRGPFFAFVTAVDPDAPPILQWDRPEARNPVSWYFRVKGSPAVDWGLLPGSYVAVAAIARQPSRWTADFKHQGDGIFFVLRGARDLYQARTRGETGIGLFPEDLRGELHGIRSAIEAYSASKELEGGEEAACGVALTGSRGGWTQVFRVTSAATCVSYCPDRMD